MIQAETGLISATGPQDQPARVGISVADIATGMYAFAGTMTALYRRERTAEGSTVEIAMIDALSEWMTQPVYYSGYGGSPWQRTGARHPTIAPYGPFTCGDGADVFLAIQSDREWERLCREVLCQTDLSADPRFVHNPERVQHEDELRTIIETRFSLLAADQAEELLDQAGIANARMREPEDLLHHPQLDARHRWREVMTPAGPIRALVPPITIAGVESAMGPVPTLGEHTEAIKREFFGPSGGAVHT